MKYYWLKLNKDFFKRHDIRIIEAMPNGKDYILFYLKLLVESVSHEGNLRFSDLIPYSEDMLAVITNTNPDIVKAAMKIFRDLNMIEVLSDETIYMAEVNKMIGSETAWAEKKRLQRQREDNVPQKSLECQDKVVEVSDKSIEIEIRDRDKDKDKDIESKDKPKAKRFVPPTLDEVKTFVEERNYTVDPERFVSYYESVGWKVGKNTMKDWKAAARGWNAREKTTAVTAKPTKRTKFNTIIEHDTNVSELEMMFVKRQGG